MRPHSSGVRRLAHLNDVLGWPDLDRIRERFWAKVERAGSDECWIWQGWWDINNRGIFHIGRHHWGAARVAYVLTAGPIADGQIIRHLCHQPRCVNPAHLRSGTHAQNMADMHAAGRARCWGWAAPYDRPSQRPRPPVRYSTIHDKVVAHIAKAGPDECWLWRGPVFSNGYGAAYWQRQGIAKAYLAHRVAWEAAFGPIPDGQLVLHLCEGRYLPGDRTARRCCNPAHLCLGTSSDNHRQCSAAGRAPCGARNGAATHPDHVPRGERHGNARLTAEQARQIRDLRAAGAGTRELMARFGVSQSVILRVLRGGSYRDA